jgi:hypothetical protein
MAKKQITKATEEKAMTSETVKEETSVLVGIIEVIVTAKKFGRYAKGDVVKMHHTTAMACVKNGVVKLK